MGLICELYRLDDLTIDKIIADHNWGYEFIMDNYASVGGRKHIEDDTVFSTDKAWAIADNLFTELGKSKGTNISILGEKVDKQYSGSDGLRTVKSAEVQRLHKLIKDVEPTALPKLYNEQTLIDQGVYRADWFDFEEDISYLISHISKIKEAYDKAASLNEGLVIRIG